MEGCYDNLIKSVKHLKVLNETFLQEENYSNHQDYKLYTDYYSKLNNIFTKIEEKIEDQLYNEKDRQMILADIVEYIYVSRGVFYIVGGHHSTRKDKISKFIKAIMCFINLLMIYDTITVDATLRRSYLNKLKEVLPEIEMEREFSRLLQFQGMVGLPQGETDADKNLNNYFDKLLPKTAGGLWHELLVYIFLLRNDLGVIVPLLLTQKFIGLSTVVVPPDFLIISKNKDIYGIEVGIKKEIQSGSFSLQTNIPTATIDTINSRVSDRCPICKKWITFCDKIIEDYSNVNLELGKNAKVKCLEYCTIFSEDEILNGFCPHAKYSRKATRAINHEFTTGKHYHYTCVLKSLDENQRNALIGQRDLVAILAHFPYYSGLETLF